MPDWTPEQLYDHFIEVLRERDRLLDEREKNSIDRMERVEQALRDHTDAAALQLQTVFDSAQRSIDKSDEAATKRSSEMSDMTRQLSDQIARFPTRELVDTRLEELSQRIYTERDAKARETQSIMLALASRVTTETFEQYVERQEDIRTAGRRATFQSALAVALAVLSLTGGIILAIVQHGHG